jgi:hypothetical protein
VSLVHRREQPLTLWRDEGDGKVEPVTTGIDWSNVTFDGPGLFHIASSPFLSTDFRIIIGSTSRIPDGFANKAKKGRFAEVAVVQGTVNYTGGTETAPFVVPAVESTVWLILAYVMLGVTILVALASIATLVIGIVVHIKGARVSPNAPIEQLIDGTPQ